MNAEADLETLARAFLEAWNSQDVETVVACYTADVIYRDPNTRGEIAGSEGLRRYLRKLFAEWRMTWALREAHPLAGKEGAAVLWQATFQRAGSSAQVEADGMDLVLFSEDKVRRNDVYFDRTVLGGLQRAAHP